jgi:hypothetical protein
MTDALWLLVGLTLGSGASLLGTWFGARLMYRKQGGTGGMFIDEGYDEVEENAGEYAEIKDKHG